MQFQSSTHEVPLHERVSHWRAALKAAWGADFRVDAAAPESFEASIGVMRAGPVRLVEIASAAHRAARETPKNDGRVAFLLQLDGCSIVDDGRRRVRLGPGDLCTMAPDRCSEVHRIGSSRQLFVGVDAERLDASLPRWREMAGVAIAAAHPRLRETVDLYRMIVDHRRELGRDCRERLATKGFGWIGELVSAAHRDADHVRRGRFAQLADFHRERIERHVVAHLRDPELGVPQVAAALGLSVRYVHKLFAGGMPLMQRVATMRLQACQREIATRGERPISDIAYAWGFNNASHFSRVFKKHHGYPPSQA